VVIVRQHLHFCLESLSVTQPAILYSLIFPQL